MISAREAAFYTLYDIMYKGAYSNLALKERLAANRGMAAAEKALLTALVYGVVSRHITLMYIIKQYSSVKMNKIDKTVLIALQMGLYQILYMDKIPDSAAVNESVKLIRNKHAKGFANAILRTFIRNEKQTEYPSLSVKYSYPEDMVRLFTDNFGDRAESIMQALNMPPKLFLRANILKNSAEALIKKLAAEGVEASRVNGALIEASGFDIAASALYKSGCFSVQDAAAYNAAIALEPHEGEMILDMCAAPGGKATHIAELTGDKAEIVACDIHPHKIKLIEGAAQRLGLSSVKARLMDATILDEKLLRAADRVLCDVPCSGLGIIRRKPDIKLGRCDIAALPALQLKMLGNGAEYVKPGGVLVYSTCTINRAENEGVTRAFLETSGFRKAYEKTYMPDSGGTDGFYICRMEK